MVYRRCRDPALKVALGVLLAMLVISLVHGLAYPCNIFNPIRWTIFALLVAASEAAELNHQVGIGSQPRLAQAAGG